MPSPVLNTPKVRRVAVAVRQLGAVRAQGVHGAAVGADHDLLQPVAVHVADRRRGPDVVGQHRRPAGLDVAREVEDVDALAVPGRRDDHLAAAVQVRDRGPGRVVVARGGEVARGGAGAVGVHRGSCRPGARRRAGWSRPRGPSGSRDTGGRAAPGTASSGRWGSGRWRASAGSCSPAPPPRTPTRCPTGPRTRPCSSSASAPRARRPGSRTSGRSARGSRGRRSRPTWSSGTRCSPAGRTPRRGPRSARWPPRRPSRPAPTGTDGATTSSVCRRRSP